MSVECFLDTNILVYAVSAAPEEAPKQARALELIEHSSFGLSAQVLQEFFVTVTRKIRRPLPVQMALDLMDQYRIFPTVSTDYSLIVRGVEAALRYRISYWDGAILAAAESLEAPILYSEDLSHAQDYGSVRCVNPFLPAD